MSHSTHAGDGASGGTESPTNSELHWLFAEPRCKMALEALDELDEPVELETLAGAITKMESRGETVDRDEVSEIAVSLHHSHLPKMDRLGVVRYDPERNLIE